jgi:uncharacterized membrane protein
VNNPAADDTSLDARLAERHAAKVSADWERLSASREKLEQHKARELAETEARSLVQIKAETERTLANQLQAVRDAERAAELATIERRMADLEATKEAERRTTLDHEAALAAQARRDADHGAQESAEKRKAATEQAAAARLTRLQAEREALAARGKSRRARLGAAWARFRAASPVTVGIVALAIGCAAGYLVRYMEHSAPIHTEQTAEPQLRLEMELRSNPAGD